MRPGLRAILTTMLLLLGILVLILVVAPVAEAQNSITVTTTDNVRLRSGPGTQFQQIGTVPFNTTVPAFGRTLDNTWIQVQYNGVLGWASSQFLLFNGDINTLPVGGIPDTPVTPTPPGNPVTPTPTAPPGAVTGTTTTVLNVRSGPGTNNATIGQLPANSTIILNGRWGSGSQVWVRFDFNGQVGWVASWLMTISGDINSLPDIQAQEAAFQNGLLTQCVSRVGVPDAAPYVSGAVPHRFALVNPETSQFHSWWNQMPTDIKANPLNITQLVACASEQFLKKIQHCYYYGPDIERFQWQMNVTVLNAQTGAVVDTETILGAPPRKCRNQEPWGLTKLEGPRIQPDQLWPYLRNLK